MSRVWIWLCCFLFAGKLSAQQVYYIYIQSENRKPFYARMNSRVYSSNAGGSLVLPKLQNGGYRVAVGFPGKTGGEEEFLFTIDNADQGYDLKEQPNGTHALFNLLNYKLEYPVSGEAAAKPAVDSAQKNNFADLLADAVKDPGVKNIETPKTTEPAKPVAEPAKPVVKAVDTPMIKSEPPPVVLPEKKEEPVVNTEPKTAPQPAQPAETKPPPVTGKVEMIFRFNGKDGSDLVYTDRTNGLNDTVRIFIPRLLEEEPKPVVKPGKEKEEPPVEVKPAEPQKQSEPPPVVEKPVVTQPPAEKKEPAQNGSFLNMELKNPNSGAVPDSAKKMIVAPDTPAKSRLVMVNTDCRKIADEDDFIKLRKKMAGEKEEAAMLTDATKAFQQRCYTTEQVKNLSVLFATDEGKYRFYDLAYPHVYDTDNFPQLEQQITDAYYKNRFRAMIRRN